MDNTIQDYVAGDKVSFDGKTFVVLENRIAKDKKKKKVLNIILIISVISLVFGMLFGVYMYRLQFGSICLPVTIADYFIVIGVFLVYIVIHEAIHGLSYLLFGKLKPKNIAFGVVIKSAMAYCISRVPVKVSVSRWTLILPVILVVIPLYIYSITSANLAILALASLVISGSAGDIYYLWMLRGNDKNQFVIEAMPNKGEYEFGFVILEED